MIDGLGLFINRAQQSRWFHFKVSAEGVVLSNSSDFPPRPEDARPSNGNPHTPWYQAQEHWDESHIHIKDTNAYNALIRAKRIYREQTNERQHQQTTPPK